MLIQLTLSNHDWILLKANLVFLVQDCREEDLRKVHYGDNGDFILVRESVGAIKLRLDYAFEKMRPVQMCASGTGAVNVITDGPGLVDLNEVRNRLKGR